MAEELTEHLKRFPHTFSPLRFSKEKLRETFSYTGEPSTEVYNRRCVQSLRQLLVRSMDQWQSSVSYLG
ncbi:MAG: hypothetical protein AB1489_36880 [Acidobacteriota bacterium]